MVGLDRLYNVIPPWTLIAPILVWIYFWAIWLTRHYKPKEERFGYIMMFGGGFLMVAIVAAFTLSFPDSLALNGDWMGPIYIESIITIIMWGVIDHIDYQ